MTSHPVLGALAPDPTVGWWRTTSAVAFGDDGVIVAVESVERLDEAAGVLGRLDPGALRDAVAERYLVLYNDVWCDEDEGDEPVDHDGFCARIAPAELTVDRTGHVELYVDDGGLFQGHWILVVFRADLTVGEIKLAG